MKRRIILLVWLASLIAGCGAASDSMPPELAQDAVRLHELNLQKTDQPVEQIGKVSDLSFDPATNSLYVAGREGAAELSDVGRVRRAVKFTPGADAVSIVHFHKKYRFLDRGAWGHPGCLYEADGNKLWTAPAESGINDIAYGALADDAKLNFVVAYNGDGGVTMLDELGRKLWNQKDGNVWHIEVFERDKEPPLIVHSNAGGLLVVRDGSGSVVRSVKLPFYLSQFSLGSYGSGSEQLLVACSDGKLWFCRTTGDVANQLPVPVKDEFAQVKSMPMRFSKDGKEYQVSVAAWKRWNRATLFVHDATGKLVYQETFPASYPSLAVLPGGRRQSDTLVVGGDQKIWRYRL